MLKLDLTAIRVQVVDSPCGFSELINLHAAERLLFRQDGRTATCSMTKVGD